MRHAQQVRPSATTTLDMDVTLSATSKREVLYCYKGMRVYQLRNAWCAEQ